MGNRPIAAGKSSFDLVDVEKVFTALALREGMSVLDVACGSGAYSLEASRYVGPEGRVYAVDLWEEGIENLRKGIAARAIGNVEVSIADVSRRIPLPDESIDACLLATVLHDLITIQKAEATLAEIRRVMREAGTLAVIEFKKIDGPPGPPIAIRITSEELIRICRPFALTPVRTLDVGPYNYLTLFARG